ncbi:PQQ-binding-like beta-propeller repeat protein [Psychromonas aquimarina]|uniref:outer membrane protein assembly factor BamB family protein n=1 Tax=Psychromonas aquimarina TaxID=444919 RepID=UPI00048A7550|nr:PQQ-binding-like beta-propeller repeat protein [Psychromonas aquimarina]
MKKYLMLFFVLLNLTACGSGGGGDSSGSATSATSTTSGYLTFTPSTITENTYMGDAKSFSVTAKLNSEVKGYVYAYVIDKVGVVKPGMSLIQVGPMSYKVDMDISQDLAAGVYTGRFEVKLCRDSACNSPIENSTSFLDYNIEILSTTNLTPLTSWANVNDWETYQGNAAHTGYVPVTLDVDKFSLRWRWSRDVHTVISPTVVADGMVYFSTESSGESSATLHALKEENASVQWQHDFGSIGILNPPAVSNGKVFVVAGDATDSVEFLWGFAAETGTELFNTETVSHSLSQSNYAPTVDNGVVYANAGWDGWTRGLNSFNGANGTSIWSTDLSTSYEWTPAVDANNAYVYEGNTFNAFNEKTSNAGLVIINKNTGAIVNRITDSYYPAEEINLSTKGSPVIGSDNTVFAINQPSNYNPAFGSDFGINQLVSFNTKDLNVNWAVSGAFKTNPVLANNVLYTRNSLTFQLEARDEFSGDILWTWTPPEMAELSSFFGNMIVTDNIIFVSTEKRVYAVDINTRTTVWSYVKPGKLALSNNGVLYINTSTSDRFQWSNGGIDAINLK